MNESQIIGKLVSRMPTHMRYALVADNVRAFSHANAIMRQWALVYPIQDEYRVPVWIECLERGRI